jgi:RND superfamily putative drug exporter
VTSFADLGRAVARRPWWVVAAWAVLALLAVPLAPRAPEVLQAGGFTADDLEAARARRSLEERIDLAPSALVIVIRALDGSRAGEPGFEAAVAASLARVPATPHVTGLLPHTLAGRQVSRDGSTVYEVVTLDLPPDRSPDVLDALLAAIVRQPNLEVLLAGGPAFYGDIQRVSEEDLRRSELLSLPLAAIALLLVFGSVVAAGVPVLVGGVAVFVALAGVTILASLTPMSIFVLNLATLLGFGLGVDYALLMASRFREELARRGGGREPDASSERAVVVDAVADTVATAGRAVAFSGATVLLGLAGLMLFDLMVLRSVGIAGAMVVGLAVAAALTLLPACLAILGRRIDALPVGLRRGGDASGGETADPTRGAWWRLANWVMDRAVPVALGTTALLVALGAPFLHVRFNAPDASILPTDVPSRIAFDQLLREFPEGEFAPLVLAVTTDGPVTDPVNVGRLFDYSRRLASDPRVSRVESVVDIDPRLRREQYQLLLGDPAGPGDRYVAESLTRTTDGDLTAFTVITRHGSNDPEARGLVHDLRDPRSALAPPAGVRVLVGGGAAEVVDVVDRVAADVPRTVLFVLISTWVILFLLLRSVVLPVKALAMNTLSILASFGALVWIFQDGNLSAPLDFVPLGFVETTMPVILFCVLFGLSMDYEVFLLTRMKEAWDRTGDNRTAVAAGLERSGRIVSSAAAIVVLVAASFALADVVLIKALGLGVAIAVALDATVVRALLVPSTMRLLGRWNWWLPEALRRRMGSGPVFDA